MQCGEFPNSEGQAELCKKYPEMEHRRGIFSVAGFLFEGQLQLDLWDASQRERRKIELLAA